MNPLSKEYNIKSSLKKYFVDILGETVTFDRSLASPDIRTKGNTAITSWYNIKFGEMGRNALADYSFDLYICTRQDAEGMLLCQNTDTIFDLLIDPTMSDGTKRIPIYDVSKDPWEQISSMVVQYIYDSPVLDITIPEDETKIKMLTVLLRWGAAI